AQQSVEVGDQRTEVGVLPGQLPADGVELEIEIVKLRRAGCQHVGHRHRVEGQGIRESQQVVDALCAAAAERQHALLKLRANRLAHARSEHVVELLKADRAARLAEREERAVAQRWAVWRARIELYEDVA